MGRRTTVVSLAAVKPANRTAKKAANKAAVNLAIFGSLLSWSEVSNLAEQKRTVMLC